VKLKRVVSLLITEDDDGEDILFDQSFTQIDDDEERYLHQQSGPKNLAANAVDEAITFENLTTAYAVLIVTNADITFKLNGGAAIELHAKAPADGEDPAKEDRGVFYFEGEITSLSFSNPSETVDARITYVLAGV
jgi:hypothetical protein